MKMSLPIKRRKPSKRKGKQHSFPKFTKSSDGKDYYLDSVWSSYDSAKVALDYEVGDRIHKEGFLKFGPNNSTAVYIRKKDPSEVTREQKLKKLEKEAKTEAREMGKEAGEDAADYIDAVYNPIERTITHEGETKDVGDWLSEMWEGWSQYSDWIGTVKTLEEIASSKETEYDFDKGDVTDWLSDELVTEYQEAHDKALLTNLAKGGD